MTLLDQLLWLCQIGTYTKLSGLKKFFEVHNNIHEKIDIYHIAGTNGKGSVCAMLAWTLSKQFDKKVGHIVSPHLVSVNERIQINGEMISDEDLLRIAKDVSQKASEQELTLWFFSLMALTAVFYFIENNVDCAVFEVWVWGRYDTTNLWENPLATAITSIWYDHAGLLWTTLEEIQWNKMGIMKPWVPCYTWIDNTVMKWWAHESWADLKIVTKTQQTNLLWFHQQRNAWIVYDMLIDQWYDSEKILTGLQQVVHPWRMQFLRPWLLVDGAHNKQWINALSQAVESMRTEYDECITVFGTTKWRNDIFWIMDDLIVGDKNYAVSPSYTKYRSVTPGTLCEYLPYTCGKADSLEKLLAQLEQESKEKKLLVVVYGSLYLAGDCIALIQ